MEHIDNWIAGKRSPPTLNRYLDGINPATQKGFYRVADSCEQDVAIAVTAAKRAFGAWAARSHAERALLLEQLAMCILDNQAMLAELESQDTGKPISIANQVDVPRSSANLQYFAAQARLLSGESFHDRGGLNYIRHQPLGIVACISPWNLPLYLLTWKIAPALATGNCVIAKPSELTPLTANKLAEMSQEVGFPPGVFNVLHGRGAEVGEALCCAETVKAISFTGSTLTGQHIAECAAPALKKVSLELGGKNPALVFADCDLDKTVQTLVKAGFSNQGQICLCASRLLVEDSIYDVFKAAYITAVKSLVVGDPAQKATQVGSLISESHRDKVLSYLALAEAEGAKVLCGGASPEEDACLLARGAFVAPTVLEGVSQSSRLVQEEIFGPVVILQRVSDEAQALQWANDSRYGLSATVWTADLARAHRLAEKLAVGIVWINTWMNRDLNTPFGGCKQSGIGREGGQYAMRFFTEPKTVCLTY